MNGFWGNYSKRLGFDYHQSSIMRDVIELISAFEELLLSAIRSFHICFSSTIPLSEDKVKLVKEQMKFYDKDFLERLNIIFSNMNE